ncbi:nucleosome assembly protein 1-like 1-B [Anopheles marshallii]|uniref:nucleosome assembly protein 1-like 1-B n=1 Tax=Anopheles marshallii TaxID=1521116 RepID=UPI00237C1D1E|nr:nucleosome assembly protein 1-like 1-B [Anopheles marshallii]
MADHVTHEAAASSPSVPSPANEPSAGRTEASLLHQISVIEKRIKEIELEQSATANPTPPNIQAKLYALRKIQLDVVDLEVKFHYKAHAMEVEYQSEFTECQRKIARIVNGEDVPELLEANPAPNDAADQPKGIPEFWLTVLKSSLLDHLIQPADEPVLKQLQDIRVLLVNEPEAGFELQFHFGSNDYFTNEVLTKQYFLRCAPNPDAPARFNGFEIYHCKGCTIDWKPEHNLTLTPGNSFFDFFNPETLYNGDYDADFNEAILECDFQYGYHIKETIVPRAVFLFLKESTHLEQGGHFACCCDRCVYVECMDDLMVNPSLNVENDGDGSKHESSTGAEVDATQDD